jgi:protein SFI1
MNGNDEELALPELTDDGMSCSLRTSIGNRPLTSAEIFALEAIVRRAAHDSTRSVTEALYNAYREELAEREINPKHDKSIYNWVSATGNRCREAKSKESRVRFKSVLIKLLADHGVTIYPRDDWPEDYWTQGSDVLEQDTRKHKTDQRRVSFDEARYEETWLSEHSESIRGQTPDGKALHARPSTPGRPYYNQRARSADPTETDWSAANTVKQASPSLLSNSQPDGPADSSMLMRSVVSEQERDAQLSEILGAFQETSDRRLVRHFLQVWHDALITLSTRNATARTIAVLYDGKTLLRQAMDTWRSETQKKIAERHQEEEFERMEHRAVWFRSLMLAQKGFEHWHASHLALKSKTMRASQLLLAMRYFRRWRRITIENNSKARQILTRKFLERWRDGTLKRHLVSEQANAHYEEALEKRLLTKWTREYRSHKAEELHEERLRERALQQWSSRYHQVQDTYHQAERQRSTQLLSSVMYRLSSKLREQQQSSASAEAHFEQKLRFNCLQTLRIQGRLGPLEKTMSLRVTLTLQRKAFSVWHVNLSLTRQAAAFDRKRLLQDAWTRWKDMLRSRALAQRIDERILVESLYKWVLQERLRLFRRAADARLARHGLLMLHSAVDDYRDTIEGRARIFEENQRRRKLASCMTRLNIAFRQREDAERAAVEFANSRALPDVLGEWKEKTQHARKLAKWAADARWYCLASRALKTWRAQTTEHQHQRRRDAYKHVRARVKYRMASTCFAIWRTKSLDVQSMEEEAQRIAMARLFATGTQAFDKWRLITQDHRDHEVQAANVDYQRLIGSAFSAMLARHAETVALEQSAASFRLESDLALQASALKRLQWTSFTASQHAKSADALLARTRDQHVKNMLRHWFVKASTLRAARNDLPEPESPSIRPASRAAARSVSPKRFNTSQVLSYTPGTPGYMRTPSRSRRAARFRPIPTPAATTPFAFDQAYLTTTPAPFTGSGNVSSPTPGEAAGLTPQVTPFSRKLRAGGFAAMPPSALRNSVFGRSTAAMGTGKSVRFARAGRFAQSTAGRFEVPREEDGDGRDDHFKSS